MHEPLHSFSLSRDEDGVTRQMSRSGYSDDGEGNVYLYRQAVERSIRGARGQAFLRKLRDALDAMPVHRLITDDIKDETGEVCALGAVDPNATGYDADDLAPHFGIAPALAAEIVYRNDEWYGDMQYCRSQMDETPEERWTRMRAWVDSIISGAREDRTP